MSDKLTPRDADSSKRKGRAFDTAHSASEKMETKSFQIPHRSPHLREIEAALSPFWAWRVTYR